MKISASIYSNTNTNLEDLVIELDNHHIDFFHIDCLDDLGVFDDIKKIKKISSTPIDLHIISSEPEKFFPLIRETATDLVTFQFEDLKEKIEIPDDISSQMGLAIVSGTPMDVFADYADQFSFILFMTTVPGKSGGRFENENFRKIRDFRAVYPGKRIHVDGGVNDEISFILRNMGIYAAVSGSYLMNSYSVGAGLLNLKSDDINSQYMVRDFMLNIDETPILKMNSDIKFIDVLRAIEDYKLGYTIVANESGKMEGIITNADVRKGLINNIEDLNDILIKDLVNREPVSINENKNINELLEMIKNQNFPILFLPVLNDDNEPVGTLKFHNLIKGES